MYHQVAQFSLALSFQIRPLSPILLGLQSHGAENTLCFAHCRCAAGMGQSGATGVMGGHG